MATVASVSRKRKRDEEKVLLGEPFVIQPHLSSVFDTSLRITPAVLFPRKYIPFNWLTGIPSRIFSAYIPALDSPGNILITKTDGERQLSAVERVSNGVFTLFKLSPIVKMKDVRRLAQLARKAVSPTPENEDVAKDCLSRNWWTDFVVDNFTVGMSGAKGYTAELSMIHPSKTKQNTTTVKPPESIDLRLLSPPAETIVFKEPTPSEVLEQTRAQYLEALYVAKTSIAYFAKSTLSRARVKFQSEASETFPPPEPAQLIDFLQSMILPLDKMDVKYRKEIAQLATEEAVDDTTVFKVGEEPYVQRWLSMNFKDKVLQRGDPALKRQTENLKIRETELQIILLLELLALKKDHTPHPEPKEDHKKKKKFKKKSSNKKKSKSTDPPDPSVVLDLLLDRLCIWRSIGSLETPVEGERPNSSHTKEGEEDRLRNFCMEVVMPFYSSRLPDICSMVQRKIGGTTAPPASARKPSIEPKRRKVSSLSRSKTTPAPTTTSTRNSTPADILALPKTNSKNVDLGAVAKKTLQKREIQMPSLKPVVNVEEELKDAIKALAKPNRSAAGAEIMDAATKRLSAGGSMRKQKKPVRNPNANSILVHATPSKKNHQRQMVPIQQLAPQDEDEEDEDSFLPPPRPQPQRNTTTASTTAIFDSPIKGSYKPTALSRPLYLNRTAGLVQVDMVPESSPGHVLSTPLKAFNTIGKKAGLSLAARKYAEDDSIPESSSPIKPTRIMDRLARSKSCLFPSLHAQTMPSKPSDLIIRDSSPLAPPLLVLGTPQKRKRIPFDDYEEEDEEETDHLLPSSVGRRSELPSSLNQTPIRPRPLSRAATFGPSSALLNPNTKLDFSKVDVVADSPVKGGVGGGSWRVMWGKSKSGRGSLRKAMRFDVDDYDYDNDEEGQGDRGEAVVGMEREKKVQVENEVDIYKSLGWDDDDDSLF